VEKISNEYFVEINRKSVKGQITVYIRVRNQALCATSCAEGLKNIVINEYNSSTNTYSSSVTFGVILLRTLVWLDSFLAGNISGPETARRHSFYVVKYQLFLGHCIFVENQSPEKLCYMPLWWCWRTLWGNKRLNLLCALDAVLLNVRTMPIVYQFKPFNDRKSQ